METTLCKTYEKEYTIRSVEMDSEYKLKKIDAVRFFQETYALYCKDNKIAAFDIIDKNLFWVLAQMKVEYIGEMPKWSEDIKVKFWFSEVSTIKIFSEFQIIYKDNVIVHGDSVWFILDISTKRPVSPKNVFEHIELNSNCVFGNHTKFLKPSGGELINSTNYKVGIFDIDFNHHLNNLRYLDFAIRTLSEDFLVSHSIKSFTVQFQKECFIDDELESSAYRKDDHNIYFILTRKSDNVTVCEINMEIEEKTDAKKNSC